jgi:hypothetical protein
MEKLEILDIIHSAIFEVSSYATDILMNSDSIMKQNICFIDLGINSIDYAEIADIVMRKLHIEHSLDIFTSTNSISDAADIFYDLISASGDIKYASSSLDDSGVSSRALQQA